MRGFATLVFFAAAVAVSASSCRNRKAINAEYSGTVFELSDSAMRAAQRDTLDLGRLRHGEKLSREFALKNAGDAPFAIIDIASDCGCATFGFNREPLKPGDEKILTVSFDSGGYRGYVVKRARILTSLSSEPYDIYVVAEVR